MKVLKIGNVDNMTRTGLGIKVLKQIGASKGDFVRFVLNEKTGQVIVERVPFEKASE